jgi:hypothetical protein
MPRQSLLFELQLMVPFVEFRLSSLSTSLCAKRPKLSAIPIAAKAFRINAEKIASVFLVLGESLGENCGLFVPSYLTFFLRPYGFESQFGNSLSPR